MTPAAFLSTIQVGITLAGFLAAAAGATTLARPLVEPLSFLGAAAAPVAVVLVTVAISFVTLVFGELAPKRLALQRAEGWSLVAARPLSALASAAKPVVWLLTRSTDLTVRVLGGDPDATRQEVGEQELRDMVAAGPLSPAQQSIIDGTFEIAERSLREIVVPRSRVHTVECTATIDETITALARSGHSRAPVVDGDLDHVVGIVHLRDLVERHGSVRRATRPAVVLPETVQVLDALARLRDERQHMAVVIGEHGGTEGIVTLEDLLEEIVGEIYDEYDRDLHPADPDGVQRSDDGTVTVPGAFAVHDLPDLGIEVEGGRLRDGRRSRARRARPHPRGRRVGRLGRLALRGPRVQPAHDRADAPQPRAVGAPRAGERRLNPTARRGGRRPPSALRRRLRPRRGRSRPAAGCGRACGTPRRRGHRPPGARP